MADHPVATRYARAAYLVAEAAGEVPKWSESLSTAASRVTAPGVIHALADPRLSPSQRREALGELLSGVVPGVVNLARLLCDRGRLDLLPAIERGFATLSDSRSGIARATVTTAVPLDSGALHRIEEQLERRFGTSVEAAPRQDPAIMGGIVIRIGNYVLDGSVKTRFDQIRAALAGAREEGE